MNNSKLQSSGNYLRYNKSVLKLKLQKGTWFYFSNIPVKYKEICWFGRITGYKNFSVLEAINETEVTPKVK